MYVIGTKPWSVHTSMSDLILVYFPLFLQDQYDNIAAHTQKGINFLEKYGHFVDQRTKIEQEYASKLRYDYIYLYKYIHYRYMLCLYF